MKNKLTIFLYHEVSDNPSKFCIDYNLNVSVELFKKQINWIKKKFTIISPADLESNFLPKNPALITFDDAFKGAFINGIDYLIKKNIPSIMFINMGHILKKTPLISAEAIYYENFVKSKNWNYDKHHFLKINPLTRNDLKNQMDKDYSLKIKKYQGELADINILNKFSKSDYVFYGNHLFEHWNSSALSIDFFDENVKLNNMALNKYDNFINFFSFPNGQPLTCFSSINISYLKKNKFKKIFFSLGGVNSNSNNFLLDRIDLREHEKSLFKFNYRLFISKINNLNIRKVFNYFRKF